MQSASVNQFCENFTVHLHFIVLKESFFFVALMEEIISLSNKKVTKLLNQLAD